MMDTLLCLICLHANTFTPIYTCLEIQLLKLFDTRTGGPGSVSPSGFGCLRVPDTRNFRLSGSSPGYALQLRCTPEPGQVKKQSSAAHTESRHVW